VAAFLGVEISHLENSVVDAAIAAGVKLYIPSQFSLDSSVDNPKLQNIIDIPPLWENQSQYHGLSKEEGS
jgi:hypothetical protein